MDHKLSKPDTDSWVDDRMAKLDPSAEWKPDADLALDRLTRRKPVLNAPWMRLAMTSTILAATVVVLVLLPWQRLWAPKPLAGNSNSNIAAQQKSESEKPVEKVQEPPQQAAPPLPPIPNAPSQDKALVPPNNERDLAVYQWTRGFSASRPRQAGQESGVQGGVLGGVVGGPETPGGIAPPPPPPPPPPPGVTAPTLVHKVAPEYSSAAKEAKIQGTVEMIVTIGTDGRVQFERFSKTLGNGLDEKAREAVEQFTFTPAMKDGVPVATMVTLTVTFSLR